MKRFMPAGERCREGPTARQAVARRARLLLLHLLVLLTACQSGLPASADEAFLKQFPYDDINKSIELRVIEGVTETTVNSVITLEVINRSDTVIVFAEDYGVRGFIFDSGSKTWIEIENAVQYPNVQRGLRPANIDGPLPPLGFVDFKPVIGRLDAETTLRILVVGHIYEGPGRPGKPVMAYLDLLLQP